MSISPLAARDRFVRRARWLVSRATHVGWIAAVALAACTGERVTAPDPVTMVAPTTSVEVGAAVQFSLLNARGAITWSSSNTAVATVVSTGFVTAVGPGTTTISASTPTQSTSVALTVVAPPALELGATTASFAARAGGANPPPQSIALRNSGGGTVSGLAISQITYDPAPASWLTATISGPSATASQPAQLQLSAAVGTLAAGTYSAQVTIASSAAGGAKEVLVTLVVGEPPTIVLSRATAEFTLPAGTNIAAPTMVDITAGVSGDVITGLSSAITYPSGGPTGWLIRTLTRGDTPAQSGLTVDATSLSPGTYRATLEISSPMAANSPQRVEVTMEVTEPPRAVLSATTATLNALVGGGNPAPVAIGITNGGGGTLPLTLQSIVYATGQPSGWLSAVLSSATAPSTLTLLATPGAIAPGTYSATVQLGTSAGVAPPPPITVTLVVSAAARIELSATTASFDAGVGGSDPDAAEITVTNSGSGTLEDLDVAVTYGAGGAGWLEASLNTTAAPATLALQPRTTGLAAGTYTATVNVTAPLADNSPRSVTVSFTLSATPTIGLSRTAVAITAPIGALSAIETVGVSNTGGGTLTGLAVSVEYGSGSNWLAVTPTGSTAPATLSLQASSLALAAGTYTATVRVTSPAALNSPRTIAVTLTVVAQPAIGLSGTSRAFSATTGGANPAAQTVAITNTGTGSLTGLSTTIAYTSGSGWLAATLNTTTAPATLTLQPSTAGLAAGTYTATVSVLSPVAFNSPRTVTVTFTVATPPAIGLSATSRSFSANAGGANPSAQTVSITNTGGGSLTGLARTITYGSGSGWLTATLNTSTAPATLTLQPSTAGLGGGTYTATVSITSPVATNSPRTVTVTFTVAPTIVLSAASRSFTAPNGGGNPSSQTVSITSQNGGTMTGIARTVAYSSGSGWLSTTLNTTTAPATLTIQPLTGSLAAGTYSATVSVTATGASNAPRTITVTFTVPAAAIGLSSTNVSLTRTSGTGTTSTSVIVSNTGAGTLSGLSTSVITGSSWLSRSLSVTSVTTGSSTLTITANAGTSGAPLAPGTYSGTIRISSPVAASRDIAVTFTVPVSLANNIWGSSGGNLNSYCSGCHFSGGSPPALTSASGFRSAMVNVPTVRRTGYPLATTYPTRIVPGNAGSSYLTYQLAKSAGAYHMPTTTTSSVPVSLRTLISTWINQGANNN